MIKLSGELTYQNIYPQNYRSKIKLYVVYRPE